MKTVAFFVPFVVLYTLFDLTMATRGLVGGETDHDLSELHKLLSQPYDGENGKGKPLGEYFF